MSKNDETRLLTAINTPMGKDWWITSLDGTESLSELYAFTLMFESGKSHIDMNALLGEPCVVRLRKEQDDKRVRYFSGCIVEVTACGEGGEDGEDERHWTYMVDVRPTLWYASQRAKFEIWQNKNVQQIVDEVLARNKVVNHQWHLQNKYKKWEYLVQYGETDLDFLCRLLEHEGIYFWFEHGKDGEKLILGDNYNVHKPFEGCEEVPYYSHNIADGYHGWSAARKPVPGHYKHRDYDFKHPKKDIGRDAEDERGHLFKEYEVHGYPGNYVDPEHGKAYADARLQALQIQQDVITLDGDVHGAVPGCRFKLINGEGLAPLDESYYREYMITYAHYSAENSDYVAGEGAGEGESFHVTIDALPANRQYRSPLKTPKPRTYGPETAVVVGPSGSEIHTDEYGRVKVHFHWDREGKKDGNDSCWIRVSYPWAGSGFGGIHIPRVGQEVIVDYEYGDPDRPFITGRVYNADQMPPWKLPTNKTQSGIESRSSLDGKKANANIIRFEDKKGGEKIEIHAERDLNLEVENDRDLKVGGKHVEVVNKNIEVTSKTGSITLTAATKIILEVGASKIVMNANGTIKITGPTRVDIN
ncbi:MAG: type VI secretion system tip protein VgrG [Betaproteobacteria bacterium]|nr:type VI secretion system tip protein VgrG [Betaproteobacteria bacterium]